MQVTYTPESGDKQEWSFKPGRVPASKGAVIERLSGMDYGDWRLDVINGGLNSRRVLLWHLQAQTHPTIRFDDVDFCPDDLEVEADLADLSWLRERIAHGQLAPGRTEDDRTMMLAAVDAQIGTLPTGDVESGKAPSPTDAVSTSSPSPSSEFDPGSTTS